MIVSSQNEPPQVEGSFWEDIRGRRSQFWIPLAMVSRGNVPKYFRPWCGIGWFGCRVSDRLVRVVSVQAGCSESRQTPEPVTRAKRSEGYRRAQSVNSIFSLTALAELKMPQLLSHLRCHAAGKPAIHARRSKTNPANSRTAGQSSLMRVPRFCRCIW